MFKISITELNNKATRIRRDLLDLIYTAKSGHLDTTYSLVEIWLAVVYSDFFHFDPYNGSDPNRDRIFLSEGHACPLQYFVNADLGYYPQERIFAEFRRPNTPFQGHTVRDLRYGFENSNGSLGIGLWQAYGCALATDRKVFCITGDGEFQEPSSLGMIALPHFLRHAPNFTLLLNNNSLAQDSPVDLGPIDRYAALYGWHVQTVDGHDFAALDTALTNAVNETKRASLIVCKTVKGKGGDVTREGHLGFHGKPPANQSEYEAYVAGIEAGKGE